MKRFFTLTIAALFLAAPAAALAEAAHPAGSSAHMRPVLFHDRSPKPHVHNVLPHH